MRKTTSRLERAFPGVGAETPTQIPRRGWVQVVRRARQEAKADQVPLLAAGVAFFMFLSLFPAMIAAVMVYGLVADPQTVAEQSRLVSETLPSDAASLVTGQMEAIAAQPQSTLGLGLVVSLSLALWSASGGVGNLVNAINIAYDEEETRGYVRRKLLSLSLTLGVIVFAAVSTGLLTVVPPALDEAVQSEALRQLLDAARWLVLLAVVTVALGVLYRYAPDRTAPRVEWVSVGATVATVVWLLASAGFSVYVDTFGKYSKTYGALAGVAVLMLWMWITAFIVLLGAEINAEAEQQTVKDTTVGEPMPLGRRGAVKADTLPGEQSTERKPG